VQIVTKLGDFPVSGYNKEIFIIGPSGVPAPAVSTKVATIFLVIFLLSLLTLFKTPEGFVIGFREIDMCTYVTKIGGFQLKNTPCTMLYLGGQGGYFQKVSEGSKTSDMTSTLGVGRDV
jgi:hypothetical protein